MRARAVVGVLLAALAVYIGLAVGRALVLIRTGGVVGVLLGVAILLLPVVGVWAAVATVRSGLRTQALAQRLHDEGGLPDTSDLPRRPSGRVERAAADAWFAERKAEVEADPEDWRRWFRLAHGYDIAGDRRRAREAMRRAQELSLRDP